VKHWIEGGALVMVKDARAGKPALRVSAPALDET
jgi:hypothetical protein